MAIRMTESGVGARPALTTPQVFQNTLTKYGSANVLHYKQDGVWYVTTVSFGVEEQLRNDETSLLWYVL